MVLLEIHTAGFAVFEFESDAPWSIDVDRIALRIEALQRMKIGAWDVHFLGSDSDVKAIKSRENAFMHLGVYLRTPALCPEL
jgi:hypothetical protein